MIALRAMEVRSKFKEVCDMVVGGETVIVSRSRNENVVVLSEHEYNEMLRAAKNAAYVEKLQKSIAEISEGRVVTKTVEELEEMTK